MMLVRSLLFAVTFTATTVMMSLLILPGLVLPYRFVLVYKQVWLKVVLWQIQTVIAIDFEERGRANIPAGPVIFAAKHQSAWDTLGPSLLHPEMVYVLKRELTWIPAWGWYLIRVGMIPIDRSKGPKALKGLVHRAREAIAKGRSVLIFPQGTRTAPGAKRPYLPGVAALYAGLDVPVVPVALNSGLFWPRRQLRKWPGTITLEYLEPISPGLDRKSFMKELADRIEPATARLESEARVRFPWLPPLQDEEKRADTAKATAKT
ncbi:MAG: 1-acyl-sn-glycerol-3-phosphate acyltransferase [Rhodospirillales bacterium]|nr:MAG: 1-acyl-sn-glycerol-3-phosphate acyltransferase [Rhodospirillales bacterium]